MDNVLTYWEACAIAKQTRQETTMLMLDFEKAFARVKWLFLNKILSTIEFPYRWIRRDVGDVQICKKLCTNCRKYWNSFRLSLDRVLIANQVLLANHVAYILMLDL